MLIARQKIRYLVALNENFLTQIATRLAPENHYVLLRIGIERWLFNKIANRAPLPTAFT